MLFLARTQLKSIQKTLLRIIKKSINITEEMYLFIDFQEKVVIAYRSNLFFLYGSSILLFLQIINPIGGYFHSLMLAMTVAASWTSLFILNRLITAIANKISLININDTKQQMVKIEFLGFLSTPKTAFLNPNDIMAVTMSNLEGFHFFVNKTDNKKIYINLKLNEYYLTPNQEVLAKLLEIQNYY